MLLKYYPAKVYFLFQAEFGLKCMKNDEIFVG